MRIGLPRAPPSHGSPQRRDRRWAPAGSADGLETGHGLHAEVKSKLLADSDVSGLRIDVDTRERIVTLTGSVGSAAEKARAIELAGKTDNVIRVEDRLTLRPR